MADLMTLANADVVLARARTGDAHALETLFRAYEGPVYNLARRICRTAEDAEDVLQETFFELCRSIGQYRGEGSLWGWIRTVASSKALMRLRRTKYRDPDELEDEVFPTRREDTLLRLDLDAALTRLEALDPRKSRIAELRFFGGQTLQETRDELEVSVATVERDWQFARSWLYHALTSPPRDER